MLQATCSPWTIAALLVVSAFLIFASHDFAFIVFTRICMRRAQVLSIALGLTQRVGALEVGLGIEILARVRSLLAALNYVLLLVLFVQRPRWPGIAPPLVRRIVRHIALKGIVSGFRLEGRRPGCRAVSSAAPRGGS